MFAVLSAGFAGREAFFIVAPVTAADPPLLSTAAPKWNDCRLEARRLTAEGLRPMHCLGHPAVARSPRGKRSARGSCA